MGVGWIQNFYNGIAADYQVNMTRKYRYSVPTDPQKWFDNVWPLFNVIFRHAEKQD